ncbi:MAG: DUF3185 domain-containing protein [Acidobacteriota bacterium]
MKIVGILLIVLGLVGVIYGGVSWTHPDKVIDVGPIEVTRDKRESLPIPPIAGAVALIAGVVMVVAGGRGRG